MNKSIFITGIAGFIGYHLALYLKSRGDHVIGCDNFNDYYSPKLKRLREENLKKQGIDIYDCDICGITNLEYLFQKNAFSHFVHLAAQAGVRYSLKYPQKYIDANVKGFVEVLELCKRQMPITLVFASSSSIYGLAENEKSKENDPTDSPISLYAATKKAGELIAHSYHHLYQIPMTALRFFTVYGPWGRPDMAYFSFAKAILEGKPIHVFNEGNLYRDFTYIDDIIQGTAAAIDKPATFDMFNLGNNNPVKLTRFIEILEDSLGKKATIEYKPMQPGDVVRTAADISKSKKHLNFSPKTPLEIGLPKFTSWYLQTHKKFYCL